MEKKDKGGNDYIGHLERVSLNSGKYYKIFHDQEYESSNFMGGQDCSEELTRVEIIGWLHDLLEDCPKWKSEHIDAIFNDVQITKAVELLTKPKNGLLYNTLAYETYIDAIKKNKYARAVKLADLEDNSNILRLETITEKDLDRFKKYHSAYFSLLT